MIYFWKSSKVEHEDHEAGVMKSDDDDEKCWTSLTVWRKSLVFSCKGFTVIDNSSGNLVYRVDNYTTGRPHQVILMDASGNPLLTMCRTKKLTLVDNWLVYEGEVAGKGKCSSKKPICCAAKHIKILHPTLNLLAHMYHGPSDKKKCAYKIEGSYANRSCRVLDESRRVIAEIKRKEAINGGASFGSEVFVLIVRPGFSPSFAMAIVLLLDQMFS